MESDQYPEVQQDAQNDLDTSALIVSTRKNNYQAFLVSISRIKLFGRISVQF
jgi:hypothetical protein